MAPTAKVSREQKRLKSDSSAKAAQRRLNTKFQNADELQAGLGSQSVEALAKALTTLRNQFTVKQSELPISSADARLLLAQQWLGRAPGAQDIFRAWDNIEPRQNSLLAIIVSALSSLLSLLSSHYTYHTLGLPIVKTLLTPQYTKKLNSYIGGAYTDLVLSSLKLYNSISLFSSGRERKNVLEAFPWELKSLPRLFSMRRRGKEEVDPLDRPDIRTLYMFLLLSFVDSDATSQVKSSFLEHHRDPFLALFKGLAQDPYPVVRRVLEVCWSGLWSDSKVKRTTKIGLFNEITISHLLKLYDRINGEDGDPERVTADLVHHFLLAICTRPGQGICFRDRGWYPPEVEGDERLSTREEDAEAEDATIRPRGGRIYNKILANILKALKANEDPRQQELTLKILEACPELVAGYWSGAGLTLEPRLSSKWIANISLFGSIILLPVPSSSFVLASSTPQVASSSSHPTPSLLYQPTPPPLSTLIENILPSVGTKNNFSKGLQQSASGLVQHCTALALCKCFMKYQKVREELRNIANALGEREGEGQEGQWRKRLRDLEREVRRRVPDFQVVVAFSHHAEGALPKEPADGGKGKGKETTGSADVAGSQIQMPNETKKALLSESAHRLLWLYQSCLPEVVSEARFDVGKLLSNFDAAGEDTEDESSESEPSKRLHDVKQLHVIRLLAATDHFSWSGKASSSKHSNLYILLKAFVQARVPATRPVLSELLENALSSSILFQEDPDEPSLWLNALPQTRRATVGAESPDGALLTDEVDAVVTFLDDCIQRCLKTPYRYIDELRALDATLNHVENDGVGQLQTLSPLLMTILEQLTIKVSNKLLSPSDVLALATFVRKLIFRLSSAVQDLQLLRLVAEKIDSALDVEKLFAQYPIVTSAIRREVSIMRDSIAYHPGPSNSMEQDTPEEVKEFLNDVEKLPLPSSPVIRKISAYELVDWVRLLEQPLQVTDVQRVTRVVSRLHPPALHELSQSFDPSSYLIWDGMEIASSVREGGFIPPFDVLFVNSTREQIYDATYRDILASCVFVGPHTLASLKRVTRIIAHCLAGSEENSALSKGLLSLLGSVIERSVTMLDKHAYSEFKGFIFVQHSTLRNYFSSITLSDVEAVRYILSVALVQEDEDDRRLVSDVSQFWINRMRSCIQDGAQAPSFAFTWLPYAALEDLFQLFDLVCRLQYRDISVIDGILSALYLARFTPSFETLLQSRMRQLMTLSSFVPNLTVLEEFMEIALASRLPFGHDGLSTPAAAADRLSNQWHQSMSNPPLEMNPLIYLNQEQWSIATVKIICHAVYSDLVPVDTFSAWMLTPSCERRNTQHLAPIFHTYLDRGHCRGESISEAQAAVWLSQVPHIWAIVADSERGSELRIACASCISLLLVMLPSAVQSKLTHMLVKKISNLSVSSMTKEMLEIGRLSVSAGSKETTLIEALVDHALQWVVRIFTANHDLTVEESLIIEELDQLLSIVTNVKSHLAEPVLTAVIQNRLQSTVALQFLVALLPKANLKPLIVNRHLQGIVQNPQFLRIRAIGPSQHRDALVDALYVMFNLHPTNTCQPSHIEPLISLYRGSVSCSDRKLLSIFQLFELQRKVSVASLLAQWSSTPDASSTSAEEALQSVDSLLMLRTALHYPQWRSYEDDFSRKNQSGGLQDDALYDPVFFMLLFAHVLSNDTPKTAFAWVELFRTNAVGLLIRAMSARDDQLRTIAMSQLALLWKTLEVADMQEKPYIVHILGLLRDALRPSAGEVPARLPSYTTLILVHALRGVFYPSNFVYPLTSRFLLQRPELDINDVPMLYSMLYSSAEHWKKDRGWIIRMLSDGMQSTADWRAFKRRHTWDILASLFQSSGTDRALRKGVLEVLANSTCIVQATTSLVLKSSLLSWIEMQLFNPKDDEAIAWLKILENIVVVVDAEKVEASTIGEWRCCIARCLSLINVRSLPVLHLATRILLRVRILSGNSVPNLSVLLEQYLSCITENTNAIVQNFDRSQFCLDHGVEFHPPHGAFRLHEVPTLNDTRRAWGESVEHLWRVSMSVESKLPSWDRLTSLLLLWRSLVGPGHSSVGEWARMNVVRNMARA